MQIKHFMSVCITTLEVTIVVENTLPGYSASPISWIIDDAWVANAIVYMLPGRTTDMPLYHATFTSYTIHSELLNPSVDLQLSHVSIQFKGVCPNGFNCPSSDCAADGHYCPHVMINIDYLYDASAQTKLLKAKPIIIPRLAFYSDSLFSQPCVVDDGCKFKDLDSVYFKFELETSVDTHAILDHVGFCGNYNPSVINSCVDYDPGSPSVDFAEFLILNGVHQPAASYLDIHVAQTEANTIKGSFIINNQTVSSSLLLIEFVIRIEINFGASSAKRMLLSSAVDVATEYEQIGAMIAITSNTISHITNSFFSLFILFCVCC
eukprot:353034_1